MKKKEEKEDQASKGKRFRIAAPDDPIYSEGWTIGSGRLFSQLAKPSQEKDEEEPDDKL
ncbi:MAG: hypothetical protein VCG02_05680 [Verrucomicrobiota bacterium]